MDNAMQLIHKFIGNPSFFWVPIITLLVIIFLSGLTGWINGWKTSMYFFGWNLTGIIAGVFVAPIIIEKLSDISFISYYVKIISDASASLLPIIVIFLILLVINFFAFLFYWIFRKKLKFAMKENKLADHSNILHRVSGMVISVIASAPISILSSDIVAIMSNENGYTKALDKLTGWLTGGKYKGTSDTRVLTKNIDHVIDFVKVISAADLEKDFDPTEAKEGLEKILNTDFAKNIDEIYESIGKSGLVSNLGDDTLKGVEASDIMDRMPAIGVELPKERIKQLHDSLTTLFNDSNNPKTSEVVGTIMVQLQKTPNPKTIK